MPELLTEKECPFPFRPIGKPVITESVENGERLRVVKATGVFQNYLRENSNGRIYPKTIWDRLLKEDSPFMKRLKEREVLGVIEHPEDGQTHLRYISHVVTEVRYATPEEISTSGGRIVEGDIIGSYETLPFGDGVYLAGLHEANVGFGISSRGQGNVVNRGGKNIVEDDFDLETWDVVYNPSVKHARPRAIESKTTESSTPTEKTVVTESKITEGDGQVGYDLPVETPDDLIDALMMMGFQHSSDSEAGAVFHKEGSDQKVTCTVTQTPGGYTIDCAGTTQEVSTPAEVWQFITSKESVLERFNPGLLFKSRALARHRGRTRKEEVQESITHPTPMTKLDELRSLRGGVIRLIQTETKKLKPSDKAIILDEVTRSRMAIDKIIHEDASLRTEGENLLKRLREFEEVVDAEPEAPSAPSAPAPDADLDNVDSPLPEEAKEVLTKAADMLKDLGGDSEEAQQTAEELEALVACDGGDCGGDDVETDFVDDIPVAESKAKAIAMVKKYRTLEAIHKATTFSANRLLERVRQTRTKKVTESGQTRQLQEYKQAATELAEMYNRDMIGVSLKLLEKTHPEVHAEHAKALEGSKSYKKFSEALAKVMPKAPAKMAESESGKTKKPVTERTTVTESAHPALSLVLRNRRTK